MNSFRLLLTPPSKGAWNMAVDEAILEAVGKGMALPTLRLYAWQPACLSLGYAQSIQDVDITRLESAGWDIVRRITGGRAILHVDELTYSIIAPYNEPLVTGSLLESYNRIARALLKALLSLDITVEINDHNPVLNSNAAGPVCFEVPSAYEITYQGKKLIGSAQARRKLGVLQHGSMPLYGDLGRITQVLLFNDETERKQALESLLLHATNLESVTGKRLDWSVAAQAIGNAFGSELDLKLKLGELSATEIKLASELVKSKYSQMEWTGRA
jgi:lipoate-protein ligase A